MFVNIYKFITFESRLIQAEKTEKKNKEKRQRITMNDVVEDCTLLKVAKLD